MNYRPLDHALTEEQQAVDQAYKILDAEVAGSRERLASAIDQGNHAGTPQSRSERDALAAHFGDRLRTLLDVETKLVFGRLDRGRERMRIGRIGLRDEDRRAVLIDWRADAAEPFYQATAADSQGVTRRRHIKVANRRVVALHDELVTNPDADAIVDAADSVLLEAVTQPRTSRMRDIVTTIQAEQDQIIRAPLPGVLVVQGGPGTGKTAVALHRIAYLLHRHRDRLERRGVLLLGPTPQFLRYVEDVLPSLGETSVVAATLEDLYPRVGSLIAESRDAATIKASERMLPVLRAAVRAQPRIPKEDADLDVDGSTVLLTRELVTAGHKAARASGESHNCAREDFCRHVLDDLCRQLCVAEAVDPTEPRARAERHSRLRRSADVRREVNLCWMPRTAEQVLSRLWRDPAFLRQCAPNLSGHERSALHRPDIEGWTRADLPLLDELAELLGPMPETANQARLRARQQADHRERIEFAADSLSSLGLDTMMDAETLADRFTAEAPTRSLAEQALADREWAYGHVVVDEAQELSPMDWRFVLRRCPSRSMTVVGDVNQTSAPAGVGDWDEVFNKLAAAKWKLVHLSVNYRSPGAIMSAATALLHSHGRTSHQTRSLRDGAAPNVYRASHADTLGALAAEVAAEAMATDAGTVTLIAPTGLREWLQPQGLPIATLSAREAKGLEFDHVVVVEPAAFVDVGPLGVNDLYVALTRATQRLSIVHHRPLPEGLAHLSTTAEFSPGKPGNSAGAARRGTRQTGHPTQGAE